MSSVANKLTQWIATLFAACLLPGAAAFAQEPPGRGAYVVASVGATSIDTSDPNNVLSDSTRAGAQVAVGYQATSWLGIEAGYFGSFGWDASFAGATTEYDIGSFPIAARASLPLKYATPYIRAGVHFWEADSSNALFPDLDGTDPLYGIGIEYPLPVRPNIALRLDWTRYAVDDTAFGPGALGIDADLDVDFYSLGIQYRF